MAEDNGIHRRRLMATAGITALAAPFIARGGSAIAADGEMMETAQAPRTDSFSLGDFKLVVVEDGTRVMENPGDTFGTGQDPADVAALLEENFLPEDKMVNGFAPVLVDTGE